MSDHADVSDKNIENFIASAIANACRQVHVQSDGYCLFCDEPVAFGLLFCNKECRDDFEKEQRTLKIAGR
ncbi:MULTISPECIES: hypothetical protein [unclassified Undibacterium]|uniref:hypothetical protein n=1 Tax=unclassified Undibacterium TaxID=2630295 RepID=UPI002AC9089A|nr:MULTISPECIES: hypothetical protein [unclassified Undibacterium]MEB0138012.1 hypothetical protein [Undibacterium sp. CCC2.1]MEB0170655.1 hypothetical protein [Undibacterium sp. CCC1.1]MEB0176996.1 hypothetical protein [Undibacterium sp. CCC3.4]MEB0216284.1 hypothetical protein [Undibacterium sp. 5I2]WPX42470.1 hypothetical protein RHM61_13855 [Undibacterium sp. CCC3.4]